MKFLATPLSVIYALGWVTVFGLQLPVWKIYLNIQLSLQAIPLWVGAMSTSQRAVMLCVWGVKAGMVHEWVAGKTL